MFTGMTKCPAGEKTPPNDKFFRCTQRFGQPCVWDAAEDPDWRAMLSLAPGTSELHLIENSTNLYYFLSVISSSCVLKHPENQTVPCVEGANGGRGFACFEPDDIPRELGLHYHFTTLKGNRFDRSFPGLDYQVIRIANKKDKTNILFLVDSEEFNEHIDT